MTCHKCGRENLEGSRYCSQCAALLAPSAPGSASEQAGAGPGRGTVLIVLLGIAAVVGMLVWAFGSGSVEGEIRSRGKPYGTYVLKPTACYSGQRQGFFGAWVTPEVRKSGGREGFQGGLKLMKSPLEEWNVYVESPLECQGFKCTIRELPRSTCKLFDVEVRNTSNSINDVWVVEGHAKLDCSTPEGGALTANLTFDGCH